MLARSVLVCVVLPAVVASGAACTSERAIVIYAAADAAVDAPKPSGPDAPTDPTTDPATDPAADRTTDPATDPAADPATDPASDPATDPATDPAADPAPDRAADLANDPATDPATDPAMDPATDPAVDRATDPASDPATDPASSGVLFADDFSGGHERYWLSPSDKDGLVSNAMDGKNAIVTLDSTDRSFTRLRCNLDGAFFKDIDISASMRFRVEPGSAGGRVRLDVRQAPGTENIFYAVGAVADDSGTVTKVGIYKKVPTDEPNYTICALAETKLDPELPPGQWHVLRLKAKGTLATDLVAYLDDRPLASATDDCASPLTATNGNTVANAGCLSGQTGLGIQVEEDVIASVDDVLVTAP